MPAEEFSFSHFFCTYIALLETACYQFGFNAASGFILLQFFLEQIQLSLLKKQKLVPFFYNLVAFCTCTSILVY